MENQVVIICSDLAGFTVILYAGRSKLNPLLVRSEPSGGMLATTDSVRFEARFLNRWLQCRSLPTPILFNDE